MTERERLIELLMQSRIYLSRREAEAIADDICFGGVKLPVRCGECVHALADTKYCKETKNIYCEYDNDVVAKTHYCSYGERRAE